MCGNMTLEKLIKWLEQQDQKLIVKDGFSTPHSDRGDYSELAFTPEPEAVKLGKMLERKVQSVILTLSDGTKAVFSGRAICPKGETRTITDIKFTEPRDLPDDCSWESL